MADPKDVTVTGDQITSVPGGTTSGGGVSKEMPTQVASDANAETVEQLRARLDKAEADRKAVQSLKDREVAEERKRREALAAELEALKKQGMTDAERVVFERDQFKAKAEELENMLRQQQEMDEYATYLSNLGVDTGKLDRSSPEAMANSAWAALTNRIKELEGKATPPATSTTQTTTSTTPQNNSKVITGSGGLPRTKPTMAEMMQAVGAKTTSDFYDWAERHPREMNQWLTQE